MRIVDNAALARCRKRGYCEYGREYGAAECSRVLHAAHLFSKGAGRVDIDANLICLCAFHHYRSHNDAITRDELLAIVAKRERRTPESIEDEIYRIRRARK